MLLCYAMLCNVLQGAVPELSFLAKPHQPNGHDDQISWLIPLWRQVGYPYYSWASMAWGCEPTTGLPMTTTTTRTMTMALIAMALVTMALTSGPGILYMWSCSSTT